MLAFCAYYEGRVKNSEEEFDNYIKNTHLPLVAKYPKLQQLRYLKKVELDGKKSIFYLSFELFFDSLEDFAVARKSAERQAAVEDAKNLEAMFDGKIHHVVYELNEIPLNR